MNKNDNEICKEQDLDLVQKLIADALRKLPLEIVNTDIIKNEVGKVGESLGWTVWPDINHLKQEWMYDLVWHKTTSEGWLEDLGLVLESEWRSPKEVIYDFNKLLLSKSQHKVIIFQGTTLAINLLCDKFILIIKQFKLTKNGEKYLFCGKDTSKNVFEFRSYLTTKYGND